MTAMTKYERDDLHRLIRQREKVLKSAAKQRSAEDLMPRLSFAEVAGESQPPVAERLLSSNALRQQRHRERQKALRNATEPLQVTTERNGGERRMRGRVRRLRSIRLRTAAQRQVPLDFIDRMIAAYSAHPWTGYTGASVVHGRACAILRDGRCSCTPEVFLKMPGGDLVEVDPTRRCKRETRQ